MATGLNYDSLTTLTFGTTSLLALTINTSQNVILTGNLTTGGALSTPNYYTNSPVTTGTVTTTSNTPGALLTPLATITVATIKLPPSPTDGQIYWVASSQQITAVTWQDSGGTAGNVIGGIATIGGVNRGQTFIYSAANTKWYATA
jgi:hypothetical protein